MRDRTMMPDQEAKLQAKLMIQSSPLTKVHEEVVFCHPHKYLAIKLGCNIRSGATVERRSKSTKRRKGQALTWL